MEEFWKIAFGVAGLGAVGSFVFWSLYRGWLRLGIFAALTPDQTFYLMWGFLAFTFAFAIAALIVFALTHATEPVAQAPPPEFAYVEGLTYMSEELPESVFGSQTDDAGKPRQWMDGVERGAESKLNDKNIMRVWLLTPKFGKPLIEFTAYIYVGTGDGLVIQPYLVGESVAQKLIPLHQVQGQGPADEYLFTVPESRGTDRLLVFIGLKQNTYSAVSKKFLIRSQPRKVSAP